MIRACAGEPYAWLERYRGRKPLFACILSYTHTSAIPGISAAGKTPQARRYTALADGEFLLKSAVRSPANSQLDSFTSSIYNSSSTCHALPPLQAGVSPALISRAVIAQQQIPCCLFSTGLPGKLGVPHIALPEVIASSLDTGCAMTPAQVNQLWQSGLQWGRRLARVCAGSYLILGECVVGGTTTAQALLSALGYDVAGQMSSSHPVANHAQKQRLVDRGLSIWQQRGDFSAAAAVAAVGDPMMVVAAAMALAASQRVGVLLAGGSQMLAVYALIQSICFAVGSGAASSNAVSSSAVSSRILVGTTRWVVEDKSARTASIARMIGAPYVASELNFSESPYVELRAYEAGFVKEGVGAGGCAIAAHLYKGWERTQLRHAVEAELMTHRRCWASA